MSVSLSETEPHRQDLLPSVWGRGVHDVRLVVADAHAALTEVLKDRLTGMPWQRCQFHLTKNALAYVPSPSMKWEVTASHRAVLDASDRAEAQRQVVIAVKTYRATAPKLAEWLEENVPEALSVLALPPSHRRRLRTINMPERLNERLNRRTREAGQFPNQASALRLVSGVPMEISEDWETGRKYLTMEPE